jgi:prepilin-type N-terminal cleavage/methylation domain-containing protein
MVRTSDGFTLLELLVAIGLLASLTAIAAPGFRTLAGEWELRAAAMRVAGTLGRARFGALRGAQSWSVRAAGDALHFGPGAAPPLRVSMPAGIVVSANSGGEVRFSRAGYAENATFLLVGTTGERRVVVNQRGRITLK